MPMLDVTAAEGTFTPDHEPVLLERLTDALLRWEKATKIPLVVVNTGAYLHVLPPVRVTAGGRGERVVRVEILTPPGSLSQAQRQGITEDATRIVSELAAGVAPERVWVLFREASDGGWGIGGRAFTNADIAAAVEASRRGLRVRPRPSGLDAPSTGLAEHRAPMGARAELQPIELFDHGAHGAASVCATLGERASRTRSGGAWPRRAGRTCARRPRRPRWWRAPECEMGGSARGRRRSSDAQMARRGSSNGAWRAIAGECRIAGRTPPIPVAACAVVAS